MITKGRARQRRRCTLCERMIPEPLLYCAPHWRLVPVELRRRLNRSYRRLARRPTRGRAQAALRLRERIVKTLETA